MTLGANEVKSAHDRNVPHGTGARHSTLRDLERQDRDLRSLHVFQRFSTVEKLLHEAGFYDGVCPLPLVTEVVIEDVKEYLDAVEQVTEK